MVQKLHVHPAVGLLGQDGQELLHHEKLQDLLHVLLQPKAHIHGKAQGAT